MFLKWDKVATNSLAFFLHFFFMKKCQIWKLRLIPNAICGDKKKTKKKTGTESHSADESKQGIAKHYMAKKGGVRVNHTPKHLEIHDTIG